MVFSLVCTGANLRSCPSTLYSLPKKKRLIEGYTRAVRKHRWRTIASPALLTSSPQIKILHTHQVLQRETIFPVTPRSKWLGRLSLKYTRKCLETWMKNSKQNSPYISYIWLFHDKNSPSWWCFLRNSRTGSKPSRRLTTQHNDKLKRKNLTLKILSVPIPE